MAPPSPPPSPVGTPCGGCGYPKMKIEIIFEIPTIENPKIDISLDFWWYTPSGPLSPPPPGAPLGGSEGVALLNLKTSRLFRSLAKISAF